MRIGLKTYGQILLLLAMVLAFSTPSPQPVEARQLNKIISVDSRLKSNGFKRGMPMLIRIFKKEGELEIWLKRNGRYHLFDIYDICAWSGKLGPKLAEGDKQAPEGFYEFSSKQLNPRSRYFRSFNLSFPNAYDRAHGRTGSYLMVHGACESIGCYAMTDPGIKDIYALVVSSLGSGQKSISVHIFPFRMTKQAMKEVKGHKWESFWHSLKKGHDWFERERIAPAVGVCNKKYVVGRAKQLKNCERISPHAEYQDD
ncbi:MAG: L,D-transpeptidase family protein [Hyphomicrobiales bacterium]